MGARSRLAGVADRAAASAALFAALCALGLAAGCAKNPYALQQQLATEQQNQIALSQKQNELDGRATALDRDNQELQTLLAQSQQQSQILKEQNDALREQLSGTAAQLTRLRDEVSANDKAQARVASTRRPAGATITANSSLKQDLAELKLGDVEVRSDADVVRIELPAGRLFDPTGARLLPGAAAIIDQAATEVARVYPDHIVGIEGHTDSETLAASQWASNHQLSVGRAMAVYEYLTSRTTLRPSQSFVVGHGPNHPVVSNATPAGRDRNRRVEIVVYPETTNRR